MKADENLTTAALVSSVASDAAATPRELALVDALILTIMEVELLSAQIDSLERSP